MTEAHGPSQPQGMPPQHPSDHGQQPQIGVYSYQPLTPPGTVAVPAKQPGGFGRGFGLGMGLALGLGVVGVVTSVVLGIVMAASIGSMAAVAGGTATTGLYTMWGDPSAPKQVRVIDISGAIMADGADGALLSSGTYGYEVASMLDEIQADDAEAVVLLVNTPGGSIAGSKAIADAVTRYRDDTGKPAFVHISSMSASGGVYSTATATKIFADHGSMVGSIGVTSGPFYYYDSVTGISGSLFESGVETSGGVHAQMLTQGRGKDFGSPWREMTEEERSVWLGGLKKEYDAFVGIVSENRGIPTKTIVDDMGAMIFDAETAKDYGLVDEIVTRADFFYRVAEEIGVNSDQLRFDGIAAPTAWESLLGAERAYGTSLPAHQAEGTVPVLSQNFCGTTTPLAFDGDLISVCGG